MSTEISPAARDKRAALGTFIERHVAPHPEVKAVVVHGSVANGTAVAGSDVDAIVLMDPVDPHLVPAEAIWNPGDDSFRSIFSAEERAGDLQLDLCRVSWQEWADPSFVCADDVRARLDVTWVAFERAGYEAGPVIERLTTMTDDQQQRLLDNALLTCDGVPEDPQAAWERDPVEALDSLNMKWDALLRCVYAVNRVWFPFRGRAVRNLRGLRWDAGLRGDLLRACVAGAADEAGYRARAAALSAVQVSILERLAHDARYGEDPIFAAFLRKHDEPGRAWNMAEWNARRRV